MNVTILGGGLAGLSTAYHLPKHIRATVYERDEKLGGLLQTQTHQGCLFDHGPHLFFHKDPYFIETFQKCVGQDNVLTRFAKTGQWSFERLIEFPYQLHLKGLPQDVVSKCVGDFKLRQEALSRGDSRDPRNYEEYCRHHFGDGFTDFFMIPYAVKIWTVHPRELSTEWTGTRIVLPDLKEVIRGSQEDRSLADNYIKDFRYPKRGGTQSFADGLASLLGDNVTVHKGQSAREIDLENKKIHFDSGKTEHFECLVSSLPLPDLNAMILNLPSPIKAEIDRLRWFGILLMNFASDQIAPNAYQWIYFDQQDAGFHRIHYPSKISDHMCPKGSASIQAEISFSKERALPGHVDALIEKTWAELTRLGFAQNGSVPKVAVGREIEYAYAIMDHHRLEAVGRIRTYLESKGMFTCGRFGEWDYIWTDRVLHSGKNAAKKVSDTFL